MTWEKRNLGVVGLIGRFRPLHLGGALLLENACSQAEELIIAIGSSNKYDWRNPFTSLEVEGMIKSYLSNFNNYEIIHIPDFGHDPRYRDGQKWKSYVIEQFGELNYFISGNEYVKNLLQDTYQIIPSYQIIPPEKRIPAKGTVVRLAMVKNDYWEKLVPKPVTEYIKDNALDVRFRREFGLETLYRLADGNYSLNESIQQEQINTWVS